jgi:hypothetical protein
MNKKLLLKPILISFLMFLPMYAAVALAGWSPMESGTQKMLNAVWGSSANDVFVVGTLGTILHYDGNPEATWSRMDNYSP